MYQPQKGCFRDQDNGSYTQNHNCARYLGNDDPTWCFNNYSRTCMCFQCVRIIDVMDSTTKLWTVGQRCRYAKLRAALAAYEFVNEGGADCNEPVIQMTLYKTRCVGHTLKVLVIPAGTSGFRGKPSISAKKRGSSRYMQAMIMFVPQQTRATHFFMPEHTLDCSTPPDRTTLPFRVEGLC
jgi:hypothetical protein